MLDSVQADDAGPGPRADRGRPRDATYDAARAGDPIESSLLISCHAHLGPGGNHPVFGSDADTMVGSMDRLGLDISCVSSARALGADLIGGNAEILAAVEAHPERFVGTVVFNPHHARESARELEQYLSRPGFGMVKVHPEFHSYPLDGPAYEPVWKIAAERRTPVLTHTWGFGKGYDHPDQGATVASRHPDVRLVLGHSGGTPDGLRASVDAARSHPHVYLDTGTSLVYRGSIEFLVEHAGVDRVLFGTDASYLEDAPQVARIAGSSLSEDDKHKIFGLNLRSLLLDAEVDLPALRGAR